MGVCFVIDFDELFTKRSLHIKPGLERIERSYEYLQRPASQIPSVLIGGTNGKGSTSGFLWSLLAANQMRVGLYTSPHLLSFAERFQLSHRSIEETEIASVWKTLESDLPRELYEELSFFELATLIAFRLFEQESLDCQVLEVGLGGRWDASNISDPAVSVLVSVSRDHQEFLGSDVLQILREKLGILRAGRPFLWGGSGEVTAEPAHREILERELARAGCPLYAAGKEFGVRESTVFVNLPGHISHTLSLSKELSQLAPYLQSNLALAAATYQVFAQTQPHLGLKPLNEIWDIWQSSEIRAPVTLLGRCQNIRAREKHAQRRLCLDVCHNPDGARRFVEAWQQKAGGRRVPAMVSILRDKEFDVILDILRPHFDPLVLYRNASERSWDQTALAERHRDLIFVETLEQAWQVLADHTGDRDTPWVACGSVFAVGQLMQYIGVRPEELTLSRVLRGDWV